jgi:hypothetical protein
MYKASPKNKRIRGNFLYKAAKNLICFSKFKIKNLKHIAVDEQNKTFAMVGTTLRPIYNLAGL